MQFSNTQSSLICPIFSPCSNYFATATKNQVFIKDAGSSDLKKFSEIYFKQGINLKTFGLKFSPDSKLLAVKLDKRIQIYDINGNLKGRIKDEQYEIQQFVWSEYACPYQMMVFFSGLTYCVIYNLQTKQQSHIKNIKFRQAKSLSFSKSSPHPGVFLAILERHNNKDCIGVYFSKTLEMLNFITLDTYDADRIQFTTTGDLIVIENKINFKIHIVDIFKGVTNSYGEKDYCMGVSTYKLSNRQDFLALGVHDDCIHLLNTATWKPICELQMSQKVNSPKTIVIKEQNDKFIHTKEVKTRLILKKETTNQNENEIPGISALEFSPNDQYLAAKINTMSLCVFIYQVSNLELITVIQTSKSVKSFKWLQSQGSQSTLCIATGTPNLFFWKDTSRQTIYEIPTPSNDINISGIQLGKHGKMMLYSVAQKKYSYAMYETSDNDDRWH